MQPILDVAALRAAIASGASPRLRFFWGHRPRKDGAISDSCFSQWWRCRFAVDGDQYASAEHYMMAEKARLFGDEDMRGQILATDDPSQAKRLGRRVRGFDEATWETARFALVTAGNLAKFEQNLPLRRHLLATGDDVLVEASPTDCIWGIGLAATDPRATDPSAWRGINLLGFALVAARARLQATSQKA
jgi:ribA/ribD-fused uncharacterized protein